VGYTPYYTTAIWFGFDKPGNSLGLSLTGSTLAGPIWGDFMREIHQGLPMKDFVKPSSGIIEVTVCAKSGLLRTPGCNEGEVNLPFLEGTQPAQYCTIHGGKAAFASPGVNMDPRPFEIGGFDTDTLLKDLRMPVLRIDLPDTQGRGEGTDTNRWPGLISEPESGSSYELELPAYNPLLD
jgi:penicillin-binding protein 1A